jgi:hypothetical protein
MSKPVCDKCKSFLTKDEIESAIYWSGIYEEKTTTTALCRECE